jgi:peptide/nickel transport system permease protein
MYGAHIVAGRSRPMLTYIVRRLLWALVLFVAVTMVTYMIFYVIPANPARLACGQRATETCIKSAEHRLGLNRPVPVQYAMFMKRLVIDRSLGRSFTNRQDVNQSILDAAPVTASLVFGGAILWMLLALPIGILSALRAAIAA